MSKAYESEHQHGVGSVIGTTLCSRAWCCGKTCYRSDGTVRAADGLVCGICVTANVTTIRDKLAATEQAEPMPDDDRRQAGAGLRAWRHWRQTVGFRVHHDEWSATYDTIEAALVRETEAGALVAAAYEAAANACDRDCASIVSPGVMCDCCASVERASIRALTPADARAKLDEMLAKAREDGAAEALKQDRPYTEAFEREAWEAGHAKGADAERAAILALALDEYDINSFIRRIRARGKETT